MGSELSVERLETELVCRLVWDKLDEVGMGMGVELSVEILEAELVSEIVDKSLEKLDVPETDEVVSTLLVGA